MDLTGRSDKENGQIMTEGDFKENDGILFTLTEIEYEDSITSETYRYGLRYTHHNRRLQ